MMADHPVGKQILELRKEKKEMLGTIWLATSTAQVKDLLNYPVTIQDLEGNRVYKYYMLDGNAKLFISFTDDKLTSMMMTTP